MNKDRKGRGEGDKRWLKHERRERISQDKGNQTKEITRDDKKGKGMVVDDTTRKRRRGRWRGQVDGR